MHQICLELIIKKDMGASTHVILLSLLLILKITTFDNIDNSSILKERYDRKQVFPWCYGLTINLLMFLFAGTIRKNENVGF